MKLSEIIGVIIVIVALLVAFTYTSQGQNLVDDSGYGPVEISLDTVSQTYAEIVPQSPFKINMVVILHYSGIKSDNLGYYLEDLGIAIQKSDKLEIKLEEIK